ncbi:MAG: hypothetical protein ABSG89_07815 [Bacteroidales bacterium]|jgi:hypothetical protein
MKKLLIIAVAFFFGEILLHAQGELDEQQKVFFRNERSIGLLLNSDGLGLSYREAKRINFLNKHLLEIDIGTLKDPKEYKISNPYVDGGGSFVFGKLNSVIYIRAGFGHQHELYRKQDLGGVAVRYFYSGGPVIAVYKPIYYMVLDPIMYQGQLEGYSLQEEKFSSDIHEATDIYGKASFTKGLNEIKALPGLYAKGGFNFEYSKQDKVIHAIEIGAQVNAFPKTIPIMYNDQNKAIFFSLFVSYRFGVIVDPMHPEETKLGNLFKKKKEQ